MDWRDIKPRDDLEIRLGVLSEGIDNTLYVGMLTAALRALGSKFEIATVELPATEFDEAIQRLVDCGFRGAGVGNPHKVHAARIGTKYFLARDSIGVANTLLFENGIYARNTEIEAFGRLIGEVEPGRALVLGSGQAARSVVMSLYQRGWSVRVWNRNAMKSRVLQTMFKRYGEVEITPNADPSGCKLIVNTTPVGLRAGEQLPIVWNHAAPRSVVADLVIRRVPTEMLRAASARGFKTIGGKQLLLEQSALALDWWTGKPTPREAMAGFLSNDGLR